MKATSKVPKKTFKAKGVDGIIIPEGDKKSHSLYKNKKRLIFFSVLFLLIVVGAVALYFAIINHKPNQNSLEVVKKEVGNHILLPTNEQPALATVVDKKKVNQTLFKKAKNGDKVLIYQNNKLMIIYRPSIDRIVDVKPVAIDFPPGTSQ